MRRIAGGSKLIRGIASIAVILSGIGAKTYMDNNNELAVEDVIEVVESSGYNHGGLLHVKGKIKNKSDIDNVKVTMTVQFMDSSKNPMKSVKEVNEDLDAGEIWNFDIASLGKNASYYSIEYIEIECE